MVKLYVTQPTLTSGQEYHVDTQGSKLVEEGEGVVLAGKGTEVIGSLRVVKRTKGVVLGVGVIV